MAIKPKTFELLLYLAEHAQQLVTKDELLSAVWPNSYVEERNLSQHVFLLRKELAATGQGEGIVMTVPGKGYQFTATVKRIPKQAESGAGPALVVHAVQQVTRVVVEEDETAAGVGLGSGAHQKDRRRVWMLAGAAAALLIAAGAWLAWSRMHARTGSHVQVVIADFENSTGDATFDRALNKVVQIDLQQSPYFTVIGEGRLRNALALMGRKADSAITGEDVREVCQRLNAQVYLTPAIAAIGGHYLVTMSASACGDGSNVGARKEDANSKADVLRAVEQVTNRIRKDVGESSASLKQFDKPLYLEKTSSLEALKLYSEATNRLNAGKVGDATQLFEHAIELDPDFAVAYADLSSMYFNLGDRVHDQQNIAKAYAMRDTVSERERLYITYRYNESVTGDVHAMKDTLGLWSATYPQDTIVMADLANHLTWIGQYRQSADVAARAVELNDGNGIHNGITIEIAARAFKHLGDYDKALGYYKEAVQLKVDSPGIHSIALEIAALRHDEKGVAQQVAWGRGTASEGLMLQNAAMAALTDGRARDSERMFAEATTAARREHTEADMAVIDAYRTRLVAELGLTARAKELSDAFTEPDTYMDELYAMAEVGDGVRARARAMERQKESPQDTLVNVEYAPSIYAALALRAGKPVEAVEQMKAAETYEMRDPTIAYLRGQAFLAAGRLSEAEAEFRRLIENPGIDDPLTPLHALAHLNLARTLAQEKKQAEARAEYQQCLEMWKDGDADLPALKQARAEMARLATQ
jgi:DNA-binding winged helix-turn-helix (wHTH) protein/tetratricopeptide (TPR) repeat protein